MEVNSFSIKLIVKYKLAVRAFRDDPDGSRTHRHGDFEVPTRPLSYGSYIKVLDRIPACHSFYRGLRLGGGRNNAVSTFARYDFNAVKHYTNLRMQIHISVGLFSVAVRIFL